MNELIGRGWPDLHLEWVDAIDVLIVSVLAQRLFLAFRGTATLQVSVALLGLWLLHGAAQAAGLVLTGRLLEWLGPLAVVLVAVLFRDEIRDVLLQTSPLRLILGHPPREAPARRLPAAIEAAFRMAGTRTGALLVFQNRDRLNDRLRGGVVLGGVVSAQILESLFCKEGPVHDGAVLIRGHRIERVGAILPLSERSGLPLHFGTRHRAALGLSEVSDAVVVVVSEERGEVSLVHGGRIEVVGDPSRLEQMLRELLRWDEPRPDGRGWRREAARQLSSFLAILLIVSAYWGLVLGPQRSLTKVTAHVDFRNIPKALELRGTSAESVEVQVAGKRPLVGALRPEEVVVFVDLKGVPAGAGRRVRLGPENVELPAGLEVKSLSPSTLYLDLEAAARKVVRVVARVEGTPPKGFRLGEVAVRPEAVTLTGPEPILRTLAEVPTEPIDLGGLGPDRRKVVDAALALSPSTVRMADGRPARVRVTITLVPEASSGKTSTDAPSPTTERGDPSP
jgi:diadenylate cyclase